MSTCSDSLIAIVLVGLTYTRGGTWGWPSCSNTHTGMLYVTPTIKSWSQYSCSSQDYDLGFFYLITSSWKNVPGRSCPTLGTWFTFFLNAKRENLKDRVDVIHYHTEQKRLQNWDKYLVPRMVIFVFQSHHLAFTSHLWRSWPLGYLQIVADEFNSANNTGSKYYCRSMVESFHNILLNREN